MQDTSFLQNVIFVYFLECHKFDALHEDWVWLDAEKNVFFSLYTSVATELATCGISSVDELYDNSWGWQHQWR